MRTDQRIFRGLPDFGLIGGEILSHDRSVNDVFGVEIAATRNHGLTNLDRTFSYRLAFNGGAARSFQRARYTSPHPEVVIGSVHNRIHLRLADVPALGFERDFPHADDHTLIIRPRNPPDFFDVRTVARI